MKDTDQLIEQMHQAERQRLERDCTPHEKTVPLLEWVSRPLWRYAAVVAAVIVAGVILLPSRQETKTQDVAHADVPQPVRQKLEEARQTVAPPSVAPRTDFAYSESSNGVRVYCENNCNPDEVLARMEMVIKTLL